MAGNASFIDTVNSAYEEASEIINTEDNWKEVKRTDQGDVVVTKKNKRGKKNYRIKAVINVAPEKLIAALKDVSSCSKWNKTLTKCELVSELSEDVKISYQVTSGGGPGMVVSPRDFILIFKM